MIEKTALFFECPAKLKVGTEAPTINAELQDVCFAFGFGFLAS